MKSCSVADDGRDAGRDPVQLHPPTWDGGSCGSSECGSRDGRARCAAAIVEIAVLDDVGFQACATAGAWELFLSTLDFSDDPLLQMSLLDLLENMANSPSDTPRAFQVVVDE